MGTVLNHAYDLLIQYRAEIITFFLGGGWAKLIYNHWTNRAKIKGKIFGFTQCLLNDQPRQGEQTAVFMLYPFLVNLRKHSVHIVEYRLRAKFDGKWIDLRPMYNLHNVELNFQEVTFRNLKENLLGRKGKPVEYGTPLHGWLFFATLDLAYYSKKVQKYELTCIDVFGAKHKVISNAKSFPDFALFQEIADFEIKSGYENQVKAPKVNLKDQVSYAPRATYTPQ